MKENITECAYQFKSQQYYAICYEVMKADGVAAMGYCAGKNDTCADCPYWYGVSDNG